ncbi:MAG TPA: thioredoxin domain-containing protein [Bacteroidota bacterium]|nr:thioredoxin domain-containing protein [Bacteroidota bacterium]
MQSKVNNAGLLAGALLSASVSGTTLNTMTADEKPKHSNRLSAEQSAYLQSASHQPVNWFPWGKEALDIAQKENKPILLDIGAVWCHWCHVMDAESYENDSIASLINQYFVAVKVDRDERPDIDFRYQAAVNAISGQGGWPLTAFLTPEGKVFYGGTYFPPEDRHGRAGFPKVLQILAERFKKEPEKILQNASHVENEIRTHLARVSDNVELNESLVDSALNSISHEYDSRYGGFGTAPKFPHASTIELLLARYDQTGEQWMIEAVKNTLRRMARGGMYDQLGGGFHRYSTDEKWIVPHFEKMLFDNGPLLRNYVHAYQVTGDELFKSVAVDIIRFTNQVLSDQTGGGFYASQDADVEPGDDGSYFTWKMNDVASVLSPEQFQAIKLHYNIYEQGEMHNDPAQNVLFIDKDSDVVASLLKKTPAEVEGLITSAKIKMSEARQKRKTPFVDKTIYGSWNGMMVSAFFDSYKAFGRDEFREFALKSLDRILRENLLEENFITHRAASVAQEGFLDDQVEITRALLDAHEVTGKSRYLQIAEAIMNKTMKIFWDETVGGFADIPASHNAIGALSMVNKPIQDSPTPGANAVAIDVLNKLHVLTENPLYREYAEKTLKFFSGSVQSYGIFAATYFLALHEFLNSPPHVVVIAEDGERAGVELFQSALRTYRTGKVVTKVKPSDSLKLPSTVKAMVQSYKRPTAYVCTSFSCAPPVYNSEDLVSTLHSFARTEQLTR